MTISISEWIHRILPVIYLPSAFKCEISDRQFGRMFTLTMMVVVVADVVAVVVMVMMGRGR